MDKTKDANSFGNIKRYSGSYKLYLERKIRNANLNLYIKIRYLSTQKI